MSSQYTHSVVPYIQRALKGSTPTRLRQLQYKVEDGYLCLRFLFDFSAQDKMSDDLDAMIDISTEIISDFPDYRFKEEVCFGTENVSTAEGWQTGYQRAPQ